MANGAGRQSLLIDATIVPALEALVKLHLGDGDNTTQKEEPPGEDEEIASTQVGEDGNGHGNVHEEANAGEGMHEEAKTSRGLGGGQEGTMPMPAAETPPAPEPLQAVCSGGLLSSVGSVRNPNAQGESQSVTKAASQVIRLRLKPLKELPHVIVSDKLKYTKITPVDVTDPKR
jgi:hypothetical protein